MIYKISVLILLGVFLISCANEEPSHAVNSSSMSNTANSFILTSDDFSDNSPIPSDCACEWLGGENRPPKLHWANYPEETNSFALIMQDETNNKGDNATKHWAILNIPVSITNIQNLI